MAKHALMVICSLSYMQTDVTTPNIVAQQCWELVRPFARSWKFDRFQTAQQLQKTRKNMHQHTTGCANGHNM